MRFRQCADTSINWVTVLHTITSERPARTTGRIVSAVAVQEHRCALTPAYRPLGAGAAKIITDTPYMNRAFNVVATDVHNIDITIDAG